MGFLVLCVNYMGQMKCNQIFNQGHENVKHMKNVFSPAVKPS